MPTTYFTNAFSLNMLPSEAYYGVLRFERVAPREAYDLLMRPDSRVVHATGHATTAVVVGNYLTRVADPGHRVVIPVARVTIRLELRDRVLVAQYVGDRLPEGATTLPAGAKIEFFLVTLAAD